MKKVTVFMGTSQKQATYQAVQEFEKNLKSYTDIDFEYVFLKDYHLKYCNGCKVCFEKGEENCPLKDDRNLLIEKMNNSDGVIFATPNYSFHVTAPLKNFLDRLAFVFHRPQFFGKTFTTIVTQGIFGGASIVKYLGNIGENLGFHVTKGCCLNTLKPITMRQQKKITQEVKKASTRFYKELMRQTSPTPSIFRLMMFRISRTSIMNILNETYRDYIYFKEKGWFESDYYYDVSLGLFKNIAGKFFDFLGGWMAKHR
ncbi:multimeric flavodoxin WrbA [Clostridium saccharoperbutylacetonicum]|uniref:Multimeric flavodoxin WrbA n=1 Tax=Clostridium saccharoperbutylacetonicum N1-4(HMT) TaxID=931276 RepID=M1MM17_9CLOT|nr:NAD(P)H-dependent oxidoreductase [Clostridium saccharoperbutylacetonicum]AGF55801.1 multimeric flavodoxin WrbA [Clostridium saccharoperbutylacetonicum N1-4(HMT)]NRT63465.1 multimeric flavodoxin WrbA [Clostridium saccharoperbutylacetonicum]NSB26827.1 multimeric flavodoxin WrbA [Clostridium saccharoperbutylacetonicum]NSB40309.1 multimeric flavodoxin WrbA [Clostridium saccharoperbutylacetonicum]